MVKCKTVDEWEKPCFSYTVKENDGTEVDKLFCRICKYYYGDKRNLSSLKGRTKNQLRAYIDGTSTIKK